MPPAAQNVPQKLVPFLQGQFLTDFPLLMAGALLSALPVIVVFVILQRQFVEGVASTGIKG